MSGLQERAANGGARRTEYVPAPLGTRPVDATYSSDDLSRGLPMAIDAFKATAPLFLPERFFVGRLEGWAVLESLVGGLLKRATITGHGEFESDTETVLFTEAYTFDDGHSDTLHWTIRKGQEGKYTGLENRLEGEAIG